MGVPPFKTPTLNKGTLRAEESMRDGYHPKMLLYALDELFYVSAQIKNSHRDEKVVLAYEILCISANRCTDRYNGIEKMGIPDALALLNIQDARHLEHLAWAVYDSALLVGPRPELLGTHTWCTVLAGLQRHIYRGCDDAAHCPPQTLGSWDHEEWVEALHHMGEDKYPVPRGGPGVARVNIPRHWCTRDNQGLHPPTRLQDIHMEQLYSPVQLRGVTAVLPCPMMSAPHPK